MKKRKDFGIIHSMKSGKVKKWLLSGVCLIAAVLTFIGAPVSAMQLRDKYKALFSGSDIIFWNPDEVDTGCNGANVTWIGDSISYLANGGSTNAADVAAQNSASARSGGGYGTAAGGYIGLVFPEAYVDAFPGRRFWTPPPNTGEEWGGQAALTAAVSTGNLRDVVVYALGGNDGTNVDGYAAAVNTDVNGLSGSDIDNLRSVVGAEKKVVLVTYYAYDQTTGQDNYYNETNTVIKEKANQYGWEVADWASIATPEDVKGGAHNSSTGSWDVHPNNAGLEKWTNLIKDTVCYDKESDYDYCVSPGLDVGSYDVMPTTSSGQVLRSLTDLINEYGQYAMTMQKNKGIPWETVFAQAVVESGAGTGASGVHKHAQYNYIGMSDPDGKVSQLSSMTPYESSSGRKWAQFGSIEKLIDGWGFWFIDYNTSRYSQGVSQYLSNYNSAKQLYDWINFYLPLYSPAEDNNDTQAMIERIAGLILPGGSIYQIIENNPDLRHSWEIGSGTSGDLCEVGGEITPDSFVVYAQCDSQWGSLKYGSEGINGSTGGTICSAGCGPTSFATIATNLKKTSITPDKTADAAGLGGMYVSGSGSSWGITQFLADKYGLQYGVVNVSAGNAVSTITTYLQQGWMVHTSGAGSAPFTTGGHYIAIVGITEDGKWWVANSVSDGTLTTYDPQAVVSAGMNLSNVRVVK